MLSECSFAGTVTRCTWFVIRHQPSKRTSAWIRFSRMSRRQVLRSWSSENVIRRSTPRWVTWLAAPGSTQRARLGIGAQLYTFTENRAVQAVPFFSNKSMFVSLRLAYAVVPEELVEPLANIRTQLDGFTPALQQMAMSLFMDEGHF